MYNPIFIATETFGCGDKRIVYVSDDESRLIEVVKEKYHLSEKQADDFSDGNVIELDNGSKITYDCYEQDEWMGD